jgi:hypothetical protein
MEEAVREEEETQVSDALEEDQVEGLLVFEADPDQDSNDPLTDLETFRPE